jgi:hypothetical protein
MTYIFKVGHGVAIQKTAIFIVPAARPLSTEFYPQIKSQNVFPLRRETRIYVST